MCRTDIAVANGWGWSARVSGAWMRPVTVTSPAGGGDTAGSWAAPCSDGAIQPRSTSTAVPSASTRGVMTWNPTLELTLRERARTSCAASYRPVTVTMVQDSPFDGAGPTTPAFAGLGATRAPVSPIAGRCDALSIRLLISERV